MLVPGFLGLLPSLPHLPQMDSRSLPFALRYRLHTRHAKELWLETDWLGMASLGAVVQCPVDLPKLTKVT